MEIMLQMWMDLYKYVMDRSIPASILISLFLFFRIILKDRFKRLQYALWIVIMLRLLLPKMPESNWSIYNYIPAYNQSSTTFLTNVSNLEKERGYDSGAWTTERAKDLSPSKLNLAVFLNPITSGYLDRYIFPVWGAGALIGTVVWLFTYIKYLLQSRNNKPLEDSLLTEILESCKTELEINRKVQLMKVRDLKSPAVTGLIKPKILIPNVILSEMNETELRHIIMHEVAHLKRNDILINWIISFVKVFYWFNPFILYAFKKMTVDREICCDLLVLSHMDSAEGIRYGHTLMKTVETSRNRFLRVGVESFSKDYLTLKKRLLVIKDQKRNSYRFSAISIVLLIFVSFTSLTNAKTVLPANMQLDNATITFLNESSNVVAIMKSHYVSKKPLNIIEKQIISEYLRENTVETEFALEQEASVRSIVDMEANVIFCVTNWLWILDNGLEGNEGWQTVAKRNIDTVDDMILDYMASIQML